MISTDDYFGPHVDCDDATDEVITAADTLLLKVNAVLEEAESHGVELEMNPKTKSLVAGETFGGFRPQSCTIGASQSAHKTGRAVDVYDPHNALDRWLSDLMLEKHDLYREHPTDTPGWCHLTDRAPGSGKRSFHP